MTPMEYQEILGEEIKSLSHQLKITPTNVELIDCLMRLGHESTYVDHLCREVEGYRRRDRDTKWNVIGIAVSITGSVVATLVTILLLSR